MRWSWKIARLAGINVYMHATFLLLVIYIVLAAWTRGHNLADTLAALAFVLAIFACIVFHELGHALAARHFGVRTRDIILLPIGGVARLERMPEKPLEELWVAVAGPLVNVAIAAGLFVLLAAFGAAPGLHELRSVSGSFLDRLMVVNLWLFGFNLIPAFPMDGGRVLRALLATRLEYTRATQIAAHVGQALALAFGLVGLFADPFLLFIALFVWMGAESEAAMVQTHTSLGGVPVQRVMLTEFRTLQPDETLAQAVEHVLAGFQHDFPVVFGDRVLGILTRDELMKALARGGSAGHVRDAMQREFRVVDSHDLLERALPLLREAKSRSIPVEHDGRLVGLLDLENVAEFMMVQSALRRAHSDVAAAQEGQSRPVIVP
ncbi:MAG TPA: site-2 protease family protein [Terriglobia bacterium]|nr:site-2 protease family protein [Terriglobia bacterium]